MSEAVNAADETQVAERKRRGRLLARQQRADLAKLLSLPEGQRFLWRLLGASGLYDLCFTGNPATTDYNLGRRSLGLQLLAEINEVRPEAYLEMQLAHRKENA